jgi:hypothetical protein
MGYMKNPSFQVSKMYNIHMKWKTEGFLYNEKNNIGNLVSEPVSEQVEAAVAVGHTSCKQRIPVTMAARSEKNIIRKVTVLRRG